VGHGRCRAVGPALAVFAVLLGFAAPAVARVDPVCDKTWDGTTGDWSDGSRWSPAGAPSPSQRACLPDGSYTVTVSGSTSPGGVTVGTGATLVVDSTNPADTYLDTRSGASPSLINRGTIQLKDGSILYATTTANEGTIEDTGTVTTVPRLESQLDNSGTFRANLALQVWPAGGTVTNLAGGTMATATTTSSMVVVGNGSNTTTLNGTISNAGAFSQGSGTVHLGSVTLTGQPIVVAGGSLDPAGTGSGQVRVTNTVDLVANIAAGFGVTVYSDSTSFGNLRLTGDRTNNGTLTMETVGSAQDVSINPVSGTPRLTNAGTLNVKPGGGGNRFMRVQLTNTATGDVHVFGGVVLTTDATGGASHTTAGDILVDATGGFNITSQDAATFTQTAGTITVNGVFNQTAGTHVHQGGTVVGTITMSSPGNAPTLDPSGPGSVLYEVHGTSHLGGNINAAATVELLGATSSSTASLDLTADRTNHGLLRLDSDSENAAQVITAAGASLTNAADGTLEILPGGGGPRALTRTVNQGFADVRASTVSGSSDSAVSFLNSGTVELDPTVELRARGGYEQTAGSTDLDNATIFVPINPGFTDIQGGVLRGKGAIGGPLRNAAEVSPGRTGAPVGSFHVVSSTWQFGTLNQASYTQTATGILAVDVDGTTAGTTYDQLEVDGPVDLAGTLEITTGAGFTPDTSVPDRFTIVKSPNTPTGTFTTVTGDESGPYDVRYGDPAPDAVVLQAGGPPPPTTRMSIADAQVIEGNAGTTNMTFTVTLSDPAQDGMKAEWETVDDTASSPGDFTASSGEVEFSSGQTQRTITVPIIGDAAVEPAERFLVRLHAPTGVKLGTARATGLILPDDLGITRVTPASAGDSGTATVTIDGGGFAPGSTVRLERTGETDVHGTVVRESPDRSRVVASFDLTGVEHGAWDLVVTAPGQGGASATAPAAFTVAAGTRPRIAVTVSAPGALRFGWDGRATVAMRNEGLNDAPLDLVRIVGTDVKLRLEGEEDYADGELDLFGDALADALGGSDVIPPRQSRRVVVYFTSTTLGIHAPLHINAEVYPAGQLDAVVAGLEPDLPEGTISGHVRNAAGEAVAGVPVSARAPRVSGDRTPHTRSRTTVSGPDGAYTLEGLADATYTVGLGREPTGSTERHQVTLSAPAHAGTADFTQDVSDVGGTVRTPGGGRVGDAEVSLVQDGDVVETVLSDGGGGFSFSVLQPGTYDLVAQHPTAGMARLDDVVVEAGVPRMGLTLTTGDRQLVVTVTGPGGAVDGARVALTPATGPAGVTTVKRTGPAGTATFAGLPAGEVDVEARAPGLAPKTQRIAVGAGSTPLGLALTAGGTVQGLISDAGTGLPDGVATAVRRGSGSARRAQADDTGHYELAGLAPGTHDLWFHSAGYAPLLVGAVVVTEGSSSVVNAPLADEGDERTAAQQAPGGGFVAGALFTVRHKATGALLFSTFAGTDGIAHLDPLPAGTYSVIVHAPGMRPAAHDLVIGSGDPGRRRRILGGQEEYAPSPRVTEPDPPQPVEDPPMETWFGVPQPQRMAYDAANRELEYLQIHWEQKLPCPKAARIYALVTAKSPLVNTFFDRWLEDWQSMSSQDRNDVGTYSTQAAELGSKLLLTVATLKPAGGLPPGVSGLELAALNTYTGTLATIAQKQASGDPFTPIEIAEKGQELLELLREADDALGATNSDALGNTVAAYNSIRDLIRFAKDVDSLPGKAAGRGDQLRQHENLYRDVVRQVNDLTNQLRAADAECPDPVDDGKPAPGGSGGSTTQSNAPNDPNDILGPLGVGTDHWFPGEQDLGYQIRFENLGPGSEHNPDNLPVATAPAVKVTVESTVDDDVDIDAVELGDIGWGDVVIPVPGGLTSYHTDVPSPDGDTVRVDGALDKGTRKLTWTIASIDPLTGEIESSPTKGFLPPEDGSGNGQGFVSYGARGEDGLAQGTAITAQARIVFDVNPFIDTPVHSNKVDVTPPASSVTSAVQPGAGGASCAEQVNLQWSGTDVGSGLDRFDIWVATDGGEFVPWLTGTTTTAGTYPAEPGHTYAFYSVARDEVGLDEAPPAGDDASRAVVRCDDVAPTAVATIVGPDDQAGWHPAPVQVRLDGVDDPGGLGVTQLIWSATGASPGGTTVSGDTTTIPVGDGVTELAFAARDAAGNQDGDRTLTVKVDAGDPTIDLRAPAEGARLNVGEAAPADYSCADARSGVETCTGSVPSGAPLDTASAGEHTFTVTATDKVGHTATVTRGYTVVAPAGGGTPPPPGGGGGPPTTPAGPAPRAFSRPPLTVAVGKVTARTVTLKLVNRQAFAITGRARLTAATGRKRALAGARAFSLRSAARGTVVLRLNAAGRRALRTHRPVRTKLAFALRAGTLRATFIKTARVRLRR
jgi:Calx-beta domain-containing protein/carboxypeptidase family protein